MSQPIDIDRKIQIAGNFYNTPRLMLLRHVGAGMWIRAADTSTAPLATAVEQTVCEWRLNVLMVVFPSILLGLIKQFLRRA